MFKNDYFEVEKVADDGVLITNRQGVPYKWGEKAVHCYCPAYNKEVSPFLLVKYSDKTWSLCHAETGPMPEATKVPEKEDGVCPIVFQEDFLDDENDKKTVKNQQERENLSLENLYKQDTCMVIKSATKDFVKSMKNRFLTRG